MKAFRMVIGRRALLALAVGGATLPRSAPAQAPAARTVRALSLADALRAAEATSEAVQIARAGVQRAEGEQLRARSQQLPQLSGSASYARTLKSQFQGISFGGGAAPDTVGPTTSLRQVCAPYFLDSTATVADRNAALAQIRTCQSSGLGGLDFGKLGFGAKNQYNLACRCRRRCSPAGGSWRRRAPPPPDGGRRTSAWRRSAPSSRSMSPSCTTTPRSATAC
jgi:hypothetical protein